MTTFDLLGDFQKRMGWADDNGKSLHSEVQSFVDSEPYLVRIQLEGEDGTATLCRMIDPAVEAEIFDRCAQLIGSYLDNVRNPLPTTSPTPSQ